MSQPPDVAALERFIAERGAGLASIHRWVGWVERAVTNECPCYWDIGTCLESKITK